MKLNLTVLDQDFSICKLSPDSNIPQWAQNSNFFSILKSNEELSILCEDNFIPKNIDKNGIYKAIKVVGPLDFSLTGITAKLSTPLAEANISILLIASYDTDYVFIKKENLEKTKKIYANFCKFV